MLTRKGKFFYGTEQRDIRDELARYSAKSYPATRFADSVCAMCGGAVFALFLDENQGAAVRICLHCKTRHPIGDNEDFLEEAELEECECPCGAGDFEISAGVALYEKSDDVKWLYLGCRCVACGLTACYGDWKNEYEDATEFLTRV